MQSRATRLARGAVTGAFAITVAALLHVSAGGVAPSALAMALGFVFATLLGTALTGRRPSLWRLAVAVGIGQAAFHLGFSLIGTGGAAPASGPHHGHGPAALAIGAAADASAAGGPSADALMWVAHVGAGVATIAFLVFAERAVWSLIATAARAVVAPFGREVAATAIAAPSLPRFDDLLEPVRSAFVFGISRRGPPAAVAA